MKRLAGLSTLALIISATSGCGWLWGEDGYFRDRGSDYLAAHQSAPMQLPAGVDTRPLEPLLPIPANVADMNAGKDFEVPRPQKLQVALEASDFSLQKAGDSRWLVALRTPSQVWTAARQFFIDSGFEIADERPQTGEFVTDWLGGARLAPALAKQLKAEDEQVRVRVRIEPGVQSNTSEIFVLSAERPADSSSEGPWTERSANPQLDAALLDDLLASLGRSAQKGESVSLLAERDFDAPNRVSLDKDGSGNPVLQMDTDFDRAWSSVGRALDAGDVRVDDLNRTLGVYYINLAEGSAKNDKGPGFFARLFGRSTSEEELEARAERYQVRLTSVASAVQVSVEKDIDTVAPADIANRVLTLIQDGLR